jgi:hypothetical protein
VVWDYVDEVFGIDGQTREPEFSFREYEYNFHGTLFQMVSLFLEEKLGMSDYRGYHLLRHTGVFLLFALSVLFFFLSLRFHFKNDSIALLGAAMLVLSPRIFGNAFYNTKDIVLMSAFVFSTYTLLRFIDRKSLKWAIIHAIATALVINARLIGVYVVALTLGMVALEILQDVRNRNGSVLFSILIYLFVSVTLTIALWPYLWENPWENFAAAFELLSKYTWEGDLRYFNTWVNSQDLPWHYALGWIHISTPIVFLLFMWGGILFFAKQTFSSLIHQKKFYSSNQGRNLLIFFAVSVVPVVVIILKDSVIYDSWRHLFFVYPGMLALAVYGFKEVKNRLSKTRLHSIPFILIALSLITSLSYIFFNHPLQNNYITIPADDLEKKFDMDYWGVNYQTALRELAAVDQSDSIRVVFSNYPGYANLWMLPEELRDRFVQTGDLDQADYYLTNYRFKQEQHRYKNNVYPILEEKEVLKVETWNAAVIGVYRLR